MKTAKKVLAVLMTVAMLFGCMAMPSYAAGGRKIDIAFVIDTTASMGDDISIVKARMTEYLEDLEASGNDYKIAIVDYREFPSRSASYDYPYKVQLDFSSDYDSIVSAINGLDLGYGGDWEETIYSALIDGLDEISWRQDAGKCAILMGDAPALDPEPFTGYTLDMAINKMKYNSTDYEEDYGDTLPDAISSRNDDDDERTAVQLFTIATYTNSEVTENFAALAEGTGGKSYEVSSDIDVGDILDEIIEEIPEVVEPVEELTFFEKIAKFFRNIFLILTFRGDEADWNF